MDEILALGPDMFGLLSRPASRARSAAFVMLNAGAIHRTGPFRLGTRLCRALADAGYPSLRFDLPGIGDTLPGAERPVEEIVGEVLDRLQEATGCRQFVIGGICSAADLGWLVALRDARVSGVLLLDGLARRGLWYQIGRWKLAFGKPASEWLEALWRRFDPVRSARYGQPAVEDIRDWPAPGVERAQLGELLARGVAILAIFTGEVSYFLHPRQFRATFGPGADDPKVTFEFWKESDHTYSSNVQRNRLIRRVGDWLSERFPE